MRTLIARLNPTINPICGVGEHDAVAPSNDLWEATSKS
jgi:hypothetical protein